MRIRKRQVPLPLSSLLPVPLSDLYFNRSPTLFTDVTGASSSSLHLPPLPTTKTTTSDHLIRGASKKKKKKNEKAFYDDDDDDDDDDYDDGDVDLDGKSIDASTSNNNNILPPTSSTQVVERWSSEKSVKVESLRKRRGVSVSNFEEDEEEEEEEEEGKKGIRKKGRRSSLNLIEEGSRCSRVNGRGWRCCQQTLVGYSLCEHHLGKGRLRSIKTTSSSVVKKKRVKLGMVKARSISSLLGQTSSTSTTTVAAAGESEITAPADHFVEYDDK